MILPFQQIELSKRRSKVLWIHTSSIGEFNTVKPLLEKLKNENTSLVITYFSSRATNYLKKQSWVDGVFRLNLPIVSIVNRFVEKIKPDALIIVEGERFPALYSAPVPKKFVVNARISEKSFKFLKMFNFFFKKSLLDIDLYLCKSLDDCKKLEQLGVPVQKLKVCGNLKIIPPTNLESIKLSIKFPQNSFIFVAGSTHEGEEEFLIPALDLLFKRISNFKAVIAPRHIERAEKVSKLLRKAFPNKQILLRSKVNHEKYFNGHILVVDTIGELLSFYKTAQATFVGGTINPKIGGHNLLEPAYFEKPVLFGPYTYKVKDLVDILTSIGLGFEVASPIDLAEKIIKLREFKVEGDNPLQVLGKKVLNCYLESLRF